MKNIENLNMLAISEYLQQELQTKDQISIVCKNPDYSKDAFGYKAWVDLAQLLYCKLLTPKILSNNLIEITFKKLNLDNSFHSAKIEEKSEKYGVDSIFFTINKLNEPSFLFAYKRALEFVDVKSRKNILNLGINKGDEYKLIQNLLSKEELNRLNFYGVDYSKSAIEYAKSSLDIANLNLFTSDINALKELNLPKMDLIISIGTLQSPGINYKPLLMQLVQEHLNSSSALILGFPNSRWIDGEMIYGAKVKNYSFSELSLLFNDVIFAKKYLQQKKFKVTITGKEYIFITAIRS